MATPGDLVKAGMLVLGSEPVREMLSKLTGRFFEHAGEGLGYAGIYLRTVLGFKFLELTRRTIEKAGFDPQAVSPKVFIPILQYASLEDDDTLSGRWAALLANAAHPEHSAEVIPGFAEVLRQLTAVEALFLDRVFDEWVADERYRNDPANSQMFITNPFLGQHLRPETLDTITEVLLSDLVRLGLISRDPEEPHWGGVVICYSLSELGRAFVKACRAPENAVETLNSKERRFQCLWCEKESHSAARLLPGTHRVCPECSYIFQGNGWDGIDGHWRAHHSEVASYEEFWNGLCKYHRD